MNDKRRPEAAQSDDGEEVDNNDITLELDRRRQLRAREEERIREDWRRWTARQVALQTGQHRFSQWSA